MVDKQGNGDYATLQEAVNATPYDVETVIILRKGVYREKVFCEKQSIILQGEGAEDTCLCFGDGAYMTHADGRPNGTFRSYTLFLGGGTARVRDITIQNDAGDGSVAGQGLAVYADAARVHMDNVRLIAHQDTLFCAPLPEKERLPGGFLGPRLLSPRRMSVQYYHRCRITGDIDFIFGGGDAVFDGCTIISRDRRKPINGYIVAPSGRPEGLGFVFRDCHMTSAAKPGSVYLGRPWRAHGRAVLLRCRLDGHIAPVGWDDWQDERNHETAFFGEYLCTGEGAAGTGRTSWTHSLSSEEAEAISRRADQAIRAVLK